MYDTHSTNITAPVWAVDINVPAPADAEQQHERVRGGGLRRDADRRDRARPARHLCSFTDEVRARRTDRARAAIVLFNEGQPGPARCRCGSTSPASKVPSRPRSGRDRDGARQRRQAGPHRARSARFDDRLAPGQLPDQERDRRDQERRSRTRSSSSARTSTASAPAPGINDNGSGSATNLEIAEQHREDEAAQQGALRLVQRRGVGPARLGGLRRRACRTAERAKIAAMLNFDMIGSPNFARLRLRRRSVGLRAARGRRAAWLGGRSRSCSSTTSRASGSRPSRPRSTAARTTGRSSRPASRPAACSPAPRRSRRRSRSRYTAGRPACRSTSVTTRAATTC